MSETLDIAAHYLNVRRTALQLATSMLGPFGDPVSSRDVEKEAVRIEHWLEHGTWPNDSEILSKLSDDEPAAE